MKKLFFVPIICFITLTSFAPEHMPNGDEKKFPSLLPSVSDESPLVSKWVDSAYSQLKLDSLGLQKNVFFYACKGYQFMLGKNALHKPQLLTICDYSQPSNSKRLYVIDLKEGKVLYNTYVSHGKNSGAVYATSFSNKPESHKSSLGFMITGETYTGKNGYSLHFDGIEPGINDKVRSRDIVMHGSNYVNAQRADEGASMGRSYGCPAISYGEHKIIIDAIKGGSCFFAYADDKWYASSSRVLNARFDWQLSASLDVTAVNN
jgi:hypothetical protein